MDLRHPRPLTPVAEHPVRGRLLNGELVGRIARGGALHDLPAARLNEQRANIGMVLFQQFELSPHMTVCENLCLAPVQHKRVTPEQAYSRAVTMLERVGLAEKVDHYPGRLSGALMLEVAADHLGVSVDGARWLPGPGGGVELQEDRHVVCGLTLALAVGRGAFTDLAASRTVTQRCAEAGRPAPTISMFDGAGESQTALRSGRVDGYLVSSSVSAYSARTAPQFFTSVLEGGFENVHEGGVLFAKDNTLLATAFQAALADPRPGRVDAVGGDLFARVRKALAWGRGVRGRDVLRHREEVPGRATVTSACPPWGSSGRATTRVPLGQAAGSEVSRTRPTTSRPGVNGGSGRSW